MLHSFLKNFSFVDIYQQINCKILKVHIYLGNLIYIVHRSPFWLCDNLEEWDGVGDGKEAHEGGDIRIAMADPC